MNKFSHKSVLFTLLVAPLVCFSFGCAPDLKSEMTKLANAAKRQINPTNLQTWALGILRTNTVNSKISVSQLPSDVQKLIGRGFQMEPNMMDSNCVHLVCWRTYKMFGSSASGFLGICIGSSSFQPAKDTEVYTNWIPGVNFWYYPGVM